MKHALLIATALLIGSAAHAHEIIHDSHTAEHSKTDGHIAINHEGHVDHLHDGHLHSVHDGHVDEHVIAVSAANPVAEEIIETVDDKGHVHSEGAHEHARVQHGDHFDSLHNGRLHFTHGDHVDDHGAIEVI